MAIGKSNFRILKLFIMKKVIVVLLCMVGMTALAQKGERHHRSAMHDMTPEQMATLQTKKMTLALDLTEAQQKQIQALNLENANMRKAAMEKRKAVKEDDGAKKPSSEERYAMKNKQLDNMIAHKAEIKEILSQEQYEKWEKMAHRKGKHWKNMNQKGKWQKHHARR